MTYLTSGTKCPYKEINKYTIISIWSPCFNFAACVGFDALLFVHVIGWQAVVFGINSASIVNRKE